MDGSGPARSTVGRRGLYVWNVSAPEVRGPMIHLDYLNPQTSQLSLDN